jgi:hypothetical protein
MRREGKINQKRETYMNRMKEVEGANRQQANKSTTHLTTIAK